MRVMREHLASERPSITRRFVIYYAEAGEAKSIKLYLTAGMTTDNRLAELFVRADRQGSFLSTALDAMAMTLSMALQHGVPMEAITSKLRHMRCEPSGSTRDEEFPTCSSPFDLIAQWLTAKFPAGRLRLGA